MIIGARLLVLVALIAGAPASAAEVVVAPGRGTLAQAIDAAEPGDTLRLGPGTYQGSVTVDTPLSIAGSDGTVVDGGGIGSVLIIDAPDSSISGLTVRGSGSSHETIDSGIKLTKKARNARVRDNVLIENLYGIDIHGARDAVVANNTITGRDDHRMNARGNGVYLWNAPGAEVRDNTIRLGRDGIFVNTSRDNVLVGNSFEDLRFAVHFMYSNGSEVSGNVSRGNHLGYALMFSRDLIVRGNRSEGDREHGIMLNYVNDAEVAGNVVRDGGEKCLFMYNANKNELRGNIFEGCPIGIHFTAGSERNTIAGNAFMGNRTQVKYVGTSMQEWSADGRGNYWSDFAGFDMNADGVADQAYRPNDMIDQVLWTQPAAALLLGSPAVQLIRWAQREFPGLLPGGVVDSAPLMAAPPPDPDMAS
jgi:nitrous oxidase accessory protein